MKESKNISNKISSWYLKNYKILLIIPLLMLLTSFYYIYDTNNKDGAPIYRDISLKGGLSSVFEIQTPIETQDLVSNLESKFPENTFIISDIMEGSIKTGFIIDTDLDEEKLIAHLEDFFEVEISFGENYNSNFISPSLSSAFFKQALIILLISFILMSLVIFIYFREIVPSTLIIVSAAFDIIVTIGVLNFLEIPVSIAGIGAILMIIGYSVDTDVLLTNRVFKEKDYKTSTIEKIYSAFSTGTLMTITTLITSVIVLILSNSVIIMEIATIIIIGLLVDYISTWIQNTGLILWYLEKKNK